MSLPQIVMDDDNARARRTDPITSHSAADRTDRNGSRSWVLFQIIEEGPLAPFQLESKGAGLWSPSRIRTAIKELEFGGLLEPSGIYRLTPSGNRAQVWQLT